jgi:hypothetical protein
MPRRLSLRHVSGGRPIRYGRRASKRGSTPTHPVGLIQADWINKTSISRRWLH